MAKKNFSWGDAAKTIYRVHQINNLKPKQLGLLALIGIVLVGGVVLIIAIAMDIALIIWGGSLLLGS